MPEWISHVLFLLRGYKVHSQGTKDEVADALARSFKEIRTPKEELTTEDSRFIDDARHLFSRLGHRGSDLGGKEIKWGREMDLEYYKAWRQAHLYDDDTLRSDTLKSSDGISAVDSGSFKPGESIVEIAGVKVAYGDKTVIGDWHQEIEGAQKDGLWWTIRRGERWGVFGPNGMLPFLTPPAHAWSKLTLW
jgi:hypothetical protein